MGLRDWIADTLAAELKPSALSVEDESHLHAGHAGSREGGETHFRVRVVSEAFAGKSRVERHRLVNALLEPAFARGLHALAIDPRSPADLGSAGQAGAATGAGRAKA